MLELDVRYAETPDGMYIAYGVAGDGPIDIVWQFEFFGNIDVMWERPTWGPMFRALAEMGRLILHDRRATGLSSRNCPPPNLETRCADVRTVLDAVGSEQAVLAGALESGAPNILFAATDPGRVRSVIWLGPSARVGWAPDYPWGSGPDYFAYESVSLAAWGTAAYAEAFREMEWGTGHHIPDLEVLDMARVTRQTATPDVARGLARIWWETDVRDVLPTVQAPALLLQWGDRDDIDEATYIASLMPNAELVALDGHPLDLEDQPRYLESIRDFLGIERPPVLVESFLSSILFTDIVGSTEKQASLGDRGWKRLVEDHHAAIRRSLDRWGGTEVDTAGDGFYATFDGPARAVRCALEAAQDIRALGIEIRAGVHTGECQLIDHKVAGIAVSIGARVAAQAGPSEVLVSQTVKDLTAGSGLTFQDAGEHELKGVPDRWHLYRVVDR